MPEHSSGRNKRKGKYPTAGIGSFRNLLFYAISLLLSLMIIIIAATVLAVTFSITGIITVSLFIVFLIIISVNLVVMGVSVRGILRSYPYFMNSLGNGRQIVATVRADRKEGLETGVKFTRDNFTDLELEIVDKLRDNRNKILQNRLVSLTGASKATISRSIYSLERKGVVLKVRKGVTNEIILVEDREL